ncbi:unnamed protein product [Dicrocoelium dendriticum]|nr:unnamed protein product [Dicrocoelium dendriticum]
MLTPCTKMPGGHSLLTYLESLRYRARSELDIVIMGDASVKVGVRVRPLSDVEINDGCSSCLSYPSDSRQIMIGQDKLFSFDYVFDETTHQETLYTQIARPMVDTVLQGYNATLLAYGQTGSGKTYSMGTCGFKSPTDSNNGIVPRMVRDIFENMSSLPFEYTIRASFLEIYNEDIHDLLGEDSSIPLPIREDNQVIKIPGLTECLVYSSDDVLSLLQSGSEKRAVGGTAMNQHSSRSHAVFTLHFLIRPKEHHSISAGSDAETVDPLAPVENVTLSSKLHLVDLAGSERQKKTRAEGDRLKEGININRGLLALGNVISALCEKDAKKRSHIPYRDSRLTRLLQDSLGGNSTTVMLACVSPADSNMEETLNTLRYADRARLIKNKPILNRADPKDAELARLRSLVAQLQSRMNKGAYHLPILSPCPVARNRTALNPSTGMISGLTDKVSKLEDELRALVDELDRTLEDNADLYKKMFDVEAVRDAICLEVDKITEALHAFKASINSHSNSDSELEDFITKVEIILSSISAIRGDGQTKVIVAKVDEVYEQCVSAQDSPACDLVPDSSDAIDVCVSKADPAATEDGAALAFTNSTFVFSTAAPYLKNPGHDFSDHCSSPTHSLFSNSEGSVSVEQRLKDKERELCDARRQLADLARLRRAKEAREAECLRLRNDIQTLKVSMVRTAKQLKDESAAYRRWRIEKEREVRRLQEHDRRLQSEMSQMACAHERQQMVLKRRVEAAAATEKRLKEMLLLQRDRRNDKRQNEASANLSKSDFAARVRSWVSSDLDLHVGMGEARYHLSQLIDSRRTLCDELRSVEASLTEECNSGEDQQRSAKIIRLTEAIESQTQQINALQQKLLDAGERLTSDQTTSTGTSEQLINSRLFQLHNIQEARIALRYLFKEVVSSKVQMLATDSRAADLEVQLTAKEHESDQLRRKAVEYSARLTNSEEQLKHLHSLMSKLETENRSLQSQLDDLRQSVTKTKRASLVRMHSYVTEPSGDVRRLSGTPILSHRRRITRQSVQILRKKRRTNSPQVLAPDSTRKGGSMLDSFDETDGPTDSSLLDPTWRLPGLTEDTNQSLAGQPKKARDIQVSKRMSRASHATGHCKCRGTCTARCSCHRAGQLCIEGSCKCLADRCQNRSAPAVTQPDPVVLRSEASDDLMGPPQLAVKFSKANRHRITRAPLLELPSPDNTTTDVLNRTFDLGTEEERHSPSKTGSTDQSISTSQMGLKHLWPRHRLSYFPSPSMRPNN